MMPIVKNSLYERRVSLLFWTLAIFAMTWLTIAFYPTFQQSSGITEALKSAPEQLRGLIGNIEDLKTFGGFVNSQIFAFRIPLFVIIMSIGAAVGLSAGEEDQGVLHTLLSAPVKRYRVVLEKFVALVLYVATVHIGVFMALAIGASSIHERYSYSLLLQGTAHSMVFGLVFGSIALALGFAIGRRGLVLAIASVYAFLDFFVNSFSESVPSLKSLVNSTLFHLYTKGNVTTAGGDWTALAIFGAIIAVAIGIGAVVFSKRDLNGN